MSCCRDHSWLGAGRSCIHTSRVPETQSPSKARGLLVFPLTKPTWSSACLTVQRGAGNGAQRPAWTWWTDPQPPTSSSLCLLALCSVCYDPCCLGSGPSSEFGRSNILLSLLLKPPLSPGMGHTLVLGQLLWSQALPQNFLLFYWGPFA